jgi:hypothetical protein
MKKLILLALTAILLLPTTATAQDKFEASLSGDLVSRYMWRGINMAGVSLQPEVCIAWKGLSLKASASTGFERDDLQDIDLHLDYTRWGFNIGVIDYWTADVDLRNRYFFFKGEKECPHQLEANIGYTCKYGSLQAYTMVYGNDYKIDGDRAYSTYVELSVPFRLGGLDWDARVGVTPMESAGTTYMEQIVTETGQTKNVTRGDWMYGESFTCNMASIRATKELEFKHFNVPVFVELHTNPYLQRANIVLGIAITSL